ncbi:MAG: cell division protein FtsA [Lachnospiraceae bacterium]|nr:cell division protein FtsA [Lachnospiraceae bacterium]
MPRKNNADHSIVFGLDIGTRSIVGTVGYFDQKKFHVVALRTKEHDERVMIDGQIHDIEGVADEIRLVKQKLELDLGFELTEVCIAAAGRVLKTVHTRVTQAMDPEVDITDENVYSLELLGAQQAYSEFVKNNDLRIKFYCVGYTVQRYFLDNYQMTNLEHHRGNEISADIIATFLPDEVVDGLYKAVGLAGLKVANLTLEPIAAMEIAIPKNYRMLNLALVDVGAGTSDISITKDEAIVAYGMIPSAGDEITEAIEKAYLVDFDTAESIKRQTWKKGIIKFTDIMGLEQKVDPQDVIEAIRPTIEIMTREISDRIKRLNGGKPVSAVFVVGGGGKVPIFTDCLAEEMGIMKERCAVRGEEVLKPIDFVVSGVTKDSLLVTPIGICLNYYNMKNNFIFVMFNGEQIKLYDNSNLRISDAAMQSGFKNEDLFPKRGSSITFTINGKTQIRRGEPGEAAVFRLNGEIASINDKIKAGDNIEVQPSTTGPLPTVELLKLPEFTDTITVHVNGKAAKLPKFASVNGVLKSGFYEVQDGDEIEMLKFYTVEQILEFMDVTLEPNEAIYVNHEPASPLTEVYDNFTVEWTYVSEEDLMVDHVRSEVEERMKDPERQKRTPGSILKEAPGEGVDAGGAAAFAAAGIISPESTGPITVTVNGKTVKLTGKDSYIFVDIFNYIDFDRSHAQGSSVATVLNGKDAEYVEPLHDGDKLEIYWRK